MPMNPRLLRPRAGTRAFRPTQIADLALWLDASTTDGYTATSGQVTQWTDLSGNARHFTQTTANNRPTLFTSSADAQTTTAATIGGKQAFFFDGVNDRLAGNTAARNIGRSVSGVTIFAVIQAVSSAAAERYIWAALTPQSNFRHAVAFQTSAFWVRLLGQRLDGDTGVNRTSANDSYADATPYVVAAQFDHASALSSLSLNGTTRIASGTHGTVGTTSDTAAGQVNIGFTGFGGFFSGLIGSLVIYHRALSATEITAVRRGLGNAWGISQ